MTGHSAQQRQPSASREFGSSVTTILVKELRSRMRGRRAFVVLTLYLSILALMAYFSYSMVAGEVGQGGSRFHFEAPGMEAVNASARIGQAIFSVLSQFQLLLVCFIAPAVTAGAISLEREKQTLDLLVTTPLRPGAIVVGKLLAALAFVFLMILAAIPLSALVLMYGGATVHDIVRQQIVLLATALGLGTIGLFWSALVKRTQAATVLTYCTVLVLAIGTLAPHDVFWRSVIGRSMNLQAASARQAPEQTVYLNPLVAMADVIAATEIGGYGDFSLLIRELRGRPRSAFDAPINVGAGCPPDARCPPEAAPNVGTSGDGTWLAGHFWTRYVFSLGLLALVLTLAAMRLVVPAGARSPLSLRRKTAIDPSAPILMPGDDEAVIEPLGETK